MLFLGPPAVEALLAIRPEEAVIDPGPRVFGLSVSQIGRRIKAATKIAGLGEGFAGHSPPRGHGPSPRPERRGSGVTGAHDSGKVGQSDHTGQVHRGPGHRHRGRGQVLPERPPGMSQSGLSRWMQSLHNNPLTALLCAIYYCDGLLCSSTKLARIPTGTCTKTAVSCAPRSQFASSPPD